MDLSDFDYDEDNFAKDLHKAQTGFQKAKEHFFDLVEHWQQLTEARFSSYLRISGESVSNKASGDVLGKPFTLHLSQICKGDHGLAVVLLSLTDNVKGTSLELDRFYINVSGDVVTEEGKVLLDSRDDKASIRLFYAILRRILKADPWG